MCHSGLAVSTEDRTIGTTVPGDVDYLPLPKDVTLFYVKVVHYFCRRAYIWWAINGPTSGDHNDRAMLAGRRRRE